MLIMGKDYRWDSDNGLSMYWKEKWHNVALAGYEPIELIGAGANGVTYKAVHKITDRTVAIKVWMPRKEEYQKQFLNEVQKIAKLHDKAIVTIHDGQILPNGFCLAVYDYIKGVSLNEWLENSPSVYKRIKVCRELLRAIHYYQAQGLLHGDLHGGNILISSDNQITIIDFGTSAFARKDQSRNRELYFVTELGKLLLKECRAYSSKHFAFKMCPLPQNRPHVDVLPGELFDFSLEPILMTETMQAYVEMMELLESLFILDHSNRVIMAGFISQSSYLNIDQIMFDVIKTYIEPQYRQLFINIVDENIEEALFPAVPDDNFNFEQVFVSSLRSYSMLAKKVHPPLILPKREISVAYQQIIDELKHWMFNEDAADKFEVTLELQDKLDESYFSIQEMIREILFYSLDQHFQRSLRLHYWFGTKMREFLWNPKLRAELEAAIEEYNAEMER